MNLIVLFVAANMCTVFVYAAASIISSNLSSTELPRNHTNSQNRSLNGNDIIHTLQRQNSRHLLGRNTECVLYLKDIQYEDGHGEDTWSCELPPEISKRFGGVIMMDIKGVSKEELDVRGAVSGESIVRVDASAYVEKSFQGHNENVVLQIPRASTYEVEMMDAKSDSRHAHNRRERIRRRLKSEIAGTLDTLKVLVVRVVDGDGKGPDANAEKLQDDIFNGKVCLKSQYEACSHGQVLIEQATEFSTLLENNIKVRGIVDVRIDAIAEEGNYKSLEFEAVTAANNTYGEEYPLAETFDFVMFCLPGGTGDWLAYAYVNDWRSFYNNKWCERVSAQMHEIGHNLNLAHSGLPGDSVYADKSGMMGFSYRSDDGPIQCFNAAKSYQLGWYKEQTLSVNPIDFIGNAQNFTLNGIADYRKDGFNGDALVSLRLEHDGSQGGIDYYIGYNHKKGCNSGTAQVPNLVTLFEKENPYANGTSNSIGPDGYGLSRRLAALKEGESMTLENYAGTTSHVTVTVNSIAGKKASITIATSLPEPTQAPTVCVGNNLQIELGTDSFGSETRWSIKEKDTEEIVMHSTEGYFSNTVYTLPSTDSSYCVMPGKCYIFTITDKGGDGMCCVYGLGYYRAILEGNKIFQGGTFREEDSIEFCIPSGDDDEYLVHTSRPSALSSERPMESPIGRPTGRPTESTTPKPDPLATTSAPSLNHPSISPSLSPNKEETKVPSSQFSSHCGDSSEFRYKKNDKWDCDWLSKRAIGKTRKICIKKIRGVGKVSHQCKKTCAQAGVGPCIKKKERLGRKRIAAIDKN